MKRKFCTGLMLVYEVKNVCGSPFIIFFSTLFPILMGVLICKTYLMQIPEAFRQAEINKEFITMSMVVPMSIFLIGHGANYSQEVEKDIPLRMDLFGFGHSGMMFAKLIANYLFLTVALAIYGVITGVLVGVQLPTAGAAVICLLALYALAAIFFVMSHAIATLTKRFGLTYAITMSIYFIFMILCGIMGIEAAMMPTAVRRIAELLPMTYVSQDFGDFWRGGSYNFGPFLQGMILLGAVAGILWFIGMWREKRRLNS